jgi:hypothetical protein
MMKQTRRSRAVCWPYRSGLVLAAAAWLGGEESARAQDEPPSKASCAQAYESAQENRAAGQLQETRKRLSVCARTECPSFVQKDCARWLEEVERELPSVVIQVEGLDAAAAGQVAIQLDGVVVPEALGGPIALDPGRHELVAESVGRPSITRVIVAQQGVQNRTVKFDFAPLPPPAPVNDQTLDVGPGGTSLRPFADVAWGVGAVGLGMFAVLGTLGRADERGLKDDCPSATVDQSRVEPGVCLKSHADERKEIYEREFLLADVGLVTGIVGTITGTVLFFLGATDASSDSASDRGDAALELDLGPTRGGGYATVRGTF